MVVFFLSVALTNLALGYALALYLHPHADSGALPIPDLQPGARALGVGDSQSHAHLPSTEVDLPERPEPVRAAAAKAAASENQNNAIEELAPANPHSESPQSDGAAEVVATAEPAAKSDASAQSPASAPTESPIVEPIEAAAGELDSLIDSNQTNRSFDQFVFHLQDYRAKLADIQQRIEQCVQQPDAGQVQACMRDLRALNYNYFEHQLEISAQMTKTASAEDSDARIRINAAVAAQSAQISDVDCALIELDPSADALGCAQQLLGEIVKLSRAGEIFADALNTAEQASV
jgi:hypothetical protein